MMIQQIKNRIPFSVKYFIRRIINPGNKYYCNVCKSHFNKFIPGGKDMQLFKDLEIVGGGFHTHDVCPVCLASYRQRSIMLYFENNGYPYRKGDILHLAPEVSFFRLFSKEASGNYICGDLEPERYSSYSNSIKIDLTDLKFPDNSFDLIMCNHILEHVPDDRKGMRELLRVLRPGGMAIIQVPVSLKLKKTFEDPDVTTEKERLEKFGQKDHLRIYAMDYIDRLKECGFQAKIFNPSDFHSVKYYDKLKLDEKEKIFLACKPKTA